ncbi:MAG TPA: hypothetical protein EYM80_01435 [Deltaproteobacteria bacterium]|jgi:hypothetical protein|nr:hypothetical protein [SAR324 cluster bacterium]MCH2265864.1 hypothetical protein [SAR324 cluster bacterium]HIN46882.1 hypothetical protein [Deltaproteobacteria bacterium]|tara:strand:+ start:845 stop:1252 length:408 start_codon:yes stop_codon:yes gene_type:complete
MEIGSIREETFSAEKSVAENIPASPLEQGLESVILEYAISTFPFSGAFENVPGYRENELPDLIQGLINEGIVKVGFYYEEMQENLTIFYFLRLNDEKHVVLGLDPNEVCVSISNVKGVFRLNDEQYVKLLKIPLC